jgi:tetratricopeptide (TPR) repeat protein
VPVPACANCGRESPQHFHFCPYDASAQGAWRAITAKLLARWGQYADAERLAREAVAIYDRADEINHQADVRMDLAEVLELAGRQSEAATAVEDALALYERKGNVVMAGMAADRLRELRGGS